MVIVFGGAVLETAQVSRLPRCVAYRECRIETGPGCFLVELDVVRVCKQNLFDVM